MQKGTSSVVILVISFCMIAVLAIGVWYYFQYYSQQNQDTKVQAPISEQSTPSQTSQPIDTPAGWQHLVSTTNNISLSYPQDARVEDSPGSINISIYGPTQKDGTELFDGISLTISTLPLNGSKLESAANNQWQNNSQTPKTGTVSQLQKINYADKDGFKYTLSNFSQNDIYILPLTQDLYLNVTEIILDPKDIGFAQLTEQIVSTIRSNY